MACRDFARAVSKASSCARSSATCSVSRKEFCFSRRLLRLSFRRASLVCGPIRRVSWFRAVSPRSTLSRGASDCWNLRVRRVCWGNSTAPLHRRKVRVPRFPTHASHVRLQLLLPSFSSILQLLHAHFLLNLPSARRIGDRLFALARHTLQIHALLPLLPLQHPACVQVLCLERGGLHALLVLQLCLVGLSPDGNGLCGDAFVSHLLHLSFRERLGGELHFLHLLECVVLAAVPVRRVGDKLWARHKLLCGGCVDAHASLWDS